jgi:predicted nucleic acid-binding protein
LAESTGVISTQVLQETWVVSVRKLGLDPLDAKEIIHGFRRFETVMVDPDMIEEAVDIHSVNGVSFWDALILAAAERASCATLLTEDMADGQVVRGVRITNPFRASKPERSR